MPHIIVMYERTDDDDIRAHAKYNCFQEIRIFILLLMAFWIFFSTENRHQRENKCEKKINKYGKKHENNKKRINLHT